MGATGRGEASPVLTRFRNTTWGTDKPNGLVRGTPYRAATEARRLRYPG